MMNNYSKDNNNTDWDKNSINSDVSANTDLKVFHGAINGNNYLSDLNPNDNNLYKKIIHKQQKEKNENLNNKINDKFNLDNYNLKEQKNDKTISNKNLKNLHGNIFNLFHQNLDNQNEKSQNINKYNNNSITNSSSQNTELLSFRNESDIKTNAINSNLNIKSNLKKVEKQQQLLMKFKDVTFEDEEIINAGSVKIFENEPKKILNSYRTMTNSQCTFKISTIEKGIALLVNSQDCIFTMPTILLPKNIQIGNNYTFFIQEINKNIQDKHKIAVLQKNYLKSFSDT